MVPRSAGEITDSRLEKLAASLCEDFFKAKGKREREKVILLTDYKPEILLKIKRYMDAYFASKGESFRVETPSTVYSIRINYFLR